MEGNTPQDPAAKALQDLLEQLPLDGAQRKSVMQTLAGEHSAEATSELKKAKVALKKLAALNEKASGVLDGMEREASVADEDPKDSAQKFAAPVIHFKKILRDSSKADVADFNVGDTVKVHTRVVEGGKERVQTFAGIVIARRGTGVNASFTVRKLSYGEGVERVFPLHTPRILKIEVVSRRKLHFKQKGKGAIVGEILKRRGMAKGSFRATKRASAKRAAAKKAAAKKAP